MEYKTRQSKLLLADPEFLLRTQGNLFECEHPRHSKSRTIPLAKLLKIFRS